MNQWLQRVSFLALLLNAAALGVHYYAVHKNADRAALPKGSVIQPVTGLDTQGFPVSESAATTSPCHIVRYTSIHCPWCRKDEHSWSDFEQTLRSHGCDSTILAPGASDLPQSASPVFNRRMVSVVPASVAQQLNLVATPTTIVLDHAWKVTWSAVGVLQPDDIDNALSSLR